MMKSSESGQNPFIHYEILKTAFSEQNRLHGGARQLGRKDGGEERPRIIGRRRWQGEPMGRK